MVVVSRSRLPGVARKACPAPAEVLFKRPLEAAGVSAESGKASRSRPVTRCGGMLGKDPRIPVRTALSVLRRAKLRPGCVESWSVASASCSVAYESQSVASASVSVAFESECNASKFPAYGYRVASASQSTALGSSRRESPSRTLPLVLKSLARRAAAAKVSRRWRRLEDASPSVSSRKASLASVASNLAPVEVSCLQVLPSASRK
jgi:hypothetical protein